MNEALSEQQRETERNVVGISREHVFIMPWNIYF